MFLETKRSYSAFKRLQQKKPGLLSQVTYSQCVGNTNKKSLSQVAMHHTFKIGKALPQKSHGSCRNMLVKVFLQLQRLQQFFDVSIHLLYKKAGTNEATNSLRAFYQPWNPPMSSYFLKQTGLLDNMTTAAQSCQQGIVVSLYKIVYRGLEQ